MAEFTLVAPVLIMLLFGLTLSAFYAFRAAAADWGVFITGVAEGVYDESAAGQARTTITWPDIAGEIQTTGLGNHARQVQSMLNLMTNRPWVFGIKLIEDHQAAAFFRLWRFYPGPPEGEID